MYRYTAEILIAIAAEKGASDVHLIAGLPPKCRIDGQIRSLTDEPLSYEDCEELGRQLAGEHVRRIDQIGQLDFSATLAGRRIRINLFRQKGALSAAPVKQYHPKTKGAGTAGCRAPVFTLE